MSFRRYALYFLPDDALADFGATWLGWDVRNGTSVPHPDIPGLPASVEDLTATPRRYGLHGTLKAPFRLADGASEAELSDDLAAFAASTPPASTGRLVAVRLSRFLALVPSGEAAPVSELAAGIVEQFDRYRAPLTKEELARRKPERLSADELRLLERWGYPHVMERFRFHITLTGPVTEVDGERTLDALAPILRPLCAPRFVIRDIALVGEGEDGFFRLIRRYPLGG
ncbi:DUF1045 domain-containing protein [Palleronia sp.]|uniref:DUF1045 domain-containing protein n=1 Tax=Palleronia sp. TaxID=1940284 RepID=UPI0035C78E39